MGEKYYSNLLRIFQLPYYNVFSEAEQKNLSEITKLSYLYYQQTIEKNKSIFLSRKNEILTIQAELSNSTAQTIPFHPLRQYVKENDIRNHLQDYQVEYDRITDFKYRDIPELSADELIYWAIHVVEPKKAYDLVQNRKTIEILTSDILIRHLIYCKLRIPIEHTTVSAIHNERYPQMNRQASQQKTKLDPSNFRKKYYEFIQNNELFMPLGVRNRDNAKKLLICPYHFLFYGMAQHTVTSPNPMRDNTTCNLLKYYNSITKIINCNPNKLLALQEHYIFSRLSQIPLAYHFTIAMSKLSLQNANFKAASINDVTLIVNAIRAIDNHLVSQELAINTLLNFTSTYGVEHITYEDLVAEITKSAENISCTWHDFIAKIEAFFQLALKEKFSSNYQKTYNYISQSKVLNDISNSETLQRSLTIPSKSPLEKIFESIFSTQYCEL